LTQVALIKLGRLVTADLLRNPDSLPAGTTLYQRGALELQRDTPVCVDHDEHRPIGRVRELFEHPDTDGLWLAALTTITAPPAWLRRGTPASISYINLRTQTLGESCRVLRGLVPEVSVLSPGVKPAQPGARVALLQRDQRPATTRPLTPAPKPVWLRQAQQEAAARGTLIRPNIGKVLGIR
jgi:hypothetical protein